TIGYWRFGDDTGTGASSAFVADSSGNGYHLSETGSPTQTSIGGSGPGSGFPDPLPSGLANNEMAETGGGINTPDAFSNDTVSAGSTFTIEALIHQTGATSTRTQYLASHWNSGSGQGRSWALGIAPGNSSTTGSAGELFMLLSDAGNDSNVFQSNLSLNISPGVDYYVAASFDESNQGTGLTFHIQDLTNNGTLISNSVGHDIGSLYASNY